jgi:cytochrome c oxidase subunit 2
VRNFVLNTERQPRTGEGVKKNRQVLLALLGVVLWIGTAQADELNMTPGVTEISREIYDLHMLIFWICVVIGVVVFGAMFWSMYQHRKSRGAVPA